MPARRWRRPARVWRSSAARPSSSAMAGAPATTSPTPTASGSPPLRGMRCSSEWAHLHPRDSLRASGKILVYTPSPVGPLSTPPALWDPCLHSWCCGTLVYTSCPVIPLFTPFGGPFGDPHLDPCPSSTPGLRDPCLHPWPVRPLSTLPALWDSRLHLLPCGFLTYTPGPLGPLSLPTASWVPHLPHPYVDTPA